MALLVPNIQHFFANNKNANDILISCEFMDLEPISGSKDYGRYDFKKFNFDLYSLKKLRLIE